MKNLKYYQSLPYTVILKRHDDQGVYWVARIAELPHCLIHGDAAEEAVTDDDSILFELTRIYGWTD